MGPGLEARLGNARALSSATAQGASPGLSPPDAVGPAFPRTEHSGTWADLIPLEPSPSVRCPAFHS